MLLLTAAAGTLDALCYLHAGVFAANMTGNIVLLGLDLIRNQQDWGGWYALSMAGETELRKGTALELAFTLAFSLLSLVPAGPRNAWIRAGLICAGAAAMGIQSVAVRCLRISVLSPLS